MATLMRGWPKAAEAAWNAEKQPLRARVELVLERRQCGTVENHGERLRKT